MLGFCHAVEKLSSQRNDIPFQKEPDDRSFLIFCSAHMAIPSWPRPSSHLTLQFETWPVNNSSWQCQYIAKQKGDETDNLILRVNTWRNIWQIVRRFWEWKDKKFTRYWKYQVTSLQHSPYATNARSYLDSTREPWLKSEAKDRLD